ncbi:MAG: hypothetical protein ABJA71_07590 [Ginsengibacter sp.]
MKYLKQIKACSCLLIICQQFISTALCQDNLNAISAAFSQYHQNSIKEKIFVHTDKSLYVAGEIALFKLYDVDASNHEPLELSKVAYVEILDSNNKHSLQAKIALHNGEGNGSFYLPLTLTSGNYKLRAYTNWMKNFGAAYFFEKDITIINVQKKINISVAKREEKFDVQFFPEGGNLVDNLPSQVAFKGVNEYGRGVTFTGILLDNADTLLAFKPEHAGMGSFSFTPLSNHSYKAYIKTISGKSEVKNLPMAYTSGYVMSLSDSADKIKVIVQSDILSQHEIYLFAHTREIIKVAVSTSWQNGKAVFLFDKEMLGDGISHITIFNDQKQPVCERLYFKKPGKQLEIKLSTDQSVYTTRKKISLTIQRDNSEISLSLSVYRLDSLQSFNDANINSYLLLSSDLKGFIEDPDFYFLKNDDETNIALDHLMLTNGWRRFKWEDVLQNTKSFFTYVPEYNGPIIAGKVINTRSGIPASNIESYISVPGFPTEFNTSLSDKKGNVAFELKNFYGSSEIMLQPHTLRDTNYRIDITDPFSNDLSATPFPVFTVQQKTANTLLEESISMQVQNIYSGKKLKHFIMPSVDTTVFYITPDAKYNLDDYTRFTTMEEVLREYVALVDVKKREGKFHLNAIDLANNQMFKTNPLVLLDGIPIFDLDKFMLTDPLKLNKLELLNRKYFLGNSTFNGILNWTSYKGDMAGYEPTNATIIDYDGLQLEREFYTPVYTNIDQESSHIPDFRNVLLWSPNIKIAGGESREINFYTSDLPGKYAVQIQGITKEGLCGNKVITFEVKKK